MPILNPEHLFEQAERLIEPPAAGPPRQVDLRRAVSAAYYGVFHATMTAVSDHFVGVSKRNSTRYALVYRSLDHGRLRSFCEDAKKAPLPAKYKRYVSAPFGANIISFATAVIDLQEKRHSADYDPLNRFKTSDAQFAIRTARAALARFDHGGSDREAFLTLLLFPPRG